MTKLETIDLTLRTVAREANPNLGNDEVDAIVKEHMLTLGRDQRFWEVGSPTKFSGIGFGVK